MKRVIKIIVALMLVGTIITTNVKNAEASGAEGVVQVVGGSIAAGGIAAGLAAVAPPALIIVGLIMIGQGIDIALTEASQAEGKTKTEFLQSKFEDFCEYTKQDFERTCNTIVTGAKILADGTIWLTDEAGRCISQFIENLVATDNIAYPSEIDTILSLGGVNIPVIAKDEMLACYVSSRDGKETEIKNKSTGANETQYALFAGYNLAHSEKQIYILCKKPKVTFSVWIDGNISTQAYTYNADRRSGLYYYPCLTYFDSNTNYIPFIDNWQSAIDALNGEFVVGSGTPSEDSFVADGTVDTSILSPASGNDIVIDTGIDLNGIASRYGDVGTITIDNYLETLKQAINGVNDLTIAVQNVATGVIDDVNVGVYNPTDVAVTNEAEEEAENQIATPVIDVNEYPSGEAAEQALNGLQFDLTKIFPFCLPFDIVHIVQKFDVPRQIPHIQISLPLPGMDETLDLDLDLTPFDGVATVLRTMELIAFVVGLAMVTRSLIRG